VRGPLADVLWVCSLLLALVSREIAVSPAVNPKVEFPLARYPSASIVTAYRVAYELQRETPQAQRLPSDLSLPSA